ncbi:MAG TPA: hypothetical protein VGV85_14610 [Longimicrobiaceae bacterium]|nr:hypothetical protein [Longimicrobiaceae bacterium]
MTTGAQRTSPRRATLLFLLAPVPALLLGVLVMRASGVPAALWGQNAAAWAAGALLCLGLRRTRTSPPRERWADAAVVLAGAALIATLVAPGMQGVHRWLKLGPVRLHAAAVLLPLLLAALPALARVRGWWASALVAAGVALALFLQPDAAQATAFAAGAAVLLLPGAGGRLPRLAGLLPLPLLAGLAWGRRDPLAPVPHVEEILGLAAGLGAGWGVAAAASLALLPAPFLVAGRGAASRAGLALGTYVAVTCLAPLAGSFPVPVMGYGVSPILGYLLGAGVFLRGAAPREAAGAGSSAP